MAQDFTFGFTPTPKPRWKLFLGSYAGQAVMLIALAHFAFREPAIVVQHPKLDHISFLPPQTLKLAPRHTIPPPPPQLLRKLAPPVTTVRLETPPPPVETAKVEPKPLPQSAK